MATDGHRSGLPDGIHRGDIRQAGHLPQLGGAGIHRVVPDSDRCHCRSLHRKWENRLCAQGFLQRQSVVDVAGRCMRSHIGVRQRLADTANRGRRILHGTPARSDVAQPSDGRTRLAGSHEAADFIRPACRHCAYGGRSCNDKVQLNGRFKMDNIILNNGVEMPRIGYGVYLIPPGITERCVREALSVGYRSIDTAQCYYNEREVGVAVRKSGLPMQLFRKSRQTLVSISSKLV